jgi:hypothetical protein
MGSWRIAPSATAGRVVARTRRAGIRSAERHDIEA